MNVYESFNITDKKYHYLVCLSVFQRYEKLDHKYNGNIICIDPARAERFYAPGELPVDFAGKDEYCAVFKRGVPNV